jgi:peptidoglycan hydrolase-like amidase
MGARNLAEKGWNYKKILSAYYPGARISGESAPLNKPAFQRDLFSMGVR